MKTRLPLLALLWLAISFIFSGCENNAQVTRLKDKEIEQQELIADQARLRFHCGQYDGVPEVIEPLCQERTTSQPLYLCELGTSYLACNKKTQAQEYFLEAYSSIEEFYDPTSEKKAVSLWGAEAEKVYKGEPYEQATLSLFVGLIFLEQGDVDNALACFKNGQIADSDVESDLYKSDYGLLQLLEAKCYQMRGEASGYDEFMAQAVNSFVDTHPMVYAQQLALLKQTSEEEDPEANPAAAEALEDELAKLKEEVRGNCGSYYSPLLKPYNTLILIWSGRSPEMQRVGMYGENRVVVKSLPRDMHIEFHHVGHGWHDVIRGFSDVSFQATTRGGREMDNVLASQAAFKKTTHDIGNAFFDAADDTSDPYAALALIGMGLVSHGIGSATNVQADIRCWKSLPDQITAIPLNLTPGTHRFQVDCYNQEFIKARSFTHEIAVDSKPFQFYNIVLPSSDPPEPEPEPQAEDTEAVEA